METSIREESNCLVARPRTESLDYTVCGEFRDAVKGRLQEALSKRLVIDLQDVAFLDSLSIGALVSLYRQVQGKRGRVALCGLSPLVANVLHMVTVDDIFEVYDDVPCALEAMCDSAPPVAGTLQSAEGKR